MTFIMTIFLIFPGFNSFGQVINAYVLSQT